MPNASIRSSRVKRSPSRRESHVPSLEDLAQTFHEAAFQGDRKKVKKMLVYGVNVDYQDEKGQTALYISCMEGYEGLTELLLKHGASPNQRNLDGDTPVHAAANNGNARILSLLVEAGGDLRLHNRRGFTARDWAWKLADAKKRKNVLDLIEKRRSNALTQSGADLLNASFQSRAGSKSLTALKRQRNKSLIGSTSVHSDGFGQICIEKGTSIGAVATVPMVQESSVRHDPYGYTYDNGPFMVMESMLWNKEPVTSKRLHKEPREGGHVDLLISELAYMSRLSHPSILLLMGTCRINNLEGLVIIYERVGLGSLYCCLYQKMETFSRLSVAVILQQTANAVLYLHRQNLFHCYISSHSIQLIRPDFAKLSNFEYMTESGSKIYASILENKYLNATYNWLAPEILSGFQPTDKSDLYGLCAVLWEFVNGQVPWHNVPADTIVQELVERGNLLELGDHIEDPFNIMLHYGLSRQPDDRRISLEQMRDHLSEYIADCERLMKPNQTTVDRASASSDKRDPRHAHFSPDVEIVSTSSGEGVGLSTDDIANALENLSVKPSPRRRTSAFGVSAPDSVPSFSEETAVKSDNVEGQSEEPSDVSDLARSRPSELKIHDSESTTPKRSANEEEMLPKTIETRKQMFPIPEHQKLTFEFHPHPLQQSTPMCQHETGSAPVDAHTQRPARGTEADSSTKTDMEELCLLASSADGAKESSSRVSFDFINNPLKKAFFEGASVSPPRQHGATSYLSPKSIGSINSLKTGANQNLGEVDRSEDPYAVQLQKETEAFIRSSAARPLSTKTKFVKHTYGYYANNIYRLKPPLRWYGYCVGALNKFFTYYCFTHYCYILSRFYSCTATRPPSLPTTTVVPCRLLSLTSPDLTWQWNEARSLAIADLIWPKGDAERQVAAQTISASVGSKIASLKAAGGSVLKASASPTFGVSLKELKMAVNQKVEPNPERKEEEAAKDLDSNFTFGSVVSHAPQTSGSALLANDFPDLSVSSSGSRHPGMETATIGDSADSKKPVLCMPSTHQHLSYVATMKSTPNYSSRLFSAKSPIHHNGIITVVEDKEERAIISSSLASKSNSKDAIRPFRLKSPLFTAQDRSPRPPPGGVCDHSGSSLPPNSRVFEGVAEPQYIQLDSEEQVFMRMVKPASHHEPCLLKPSKIGILASPQPGAAPEALLSSRNSSGYGMLLATEKEHLSLTLPSKATAPFKDKRLESLKNEMDAMHRFKSDSVLQNKMDATTQHRSSPQTPVSNGNESQQAETAAEGSIKDLISSYQTKMEEHKRKQSILTLKRNPNQGGDSLSITSSGNEQQWSKLNISSELATPVTLQALQCSMEGRLKMEPGKLLPSGKVGVERMANNGENLVKTSSSIKRLAKPEKSEKDVCVSKLQLSLTSPAVAKIRLQGDENASKEVSELVNQAILNSHEQILNKYVHQECPHKSTDMTSLRTALGVSGTILNKNDEGMGGSGVAAASATKLSIRSGASEGSGPSSTSYTVIPRFRSIAINTNRKDHQERGTQKGQVSPTESASSRISSSDIKEFYYDDELNCPELAIEKHLRLQSTADFNSSENIVTTSTPPPRLCPSFNFPSGGCSGSDGDGQMGRRTSSKADKLTKNMLVTPGDNGTEADGKTRGLSVNGTESGHDTDTDSTLSSMTEALCVTKHINTSRNEGYSSSVTVESHSKGYHTITCNKMDPLTGNQSTTYRAKVKAPRVITKFILDDDEHERPFPG